jgi:nucleoside-diphosphate-sugar epimerase
VSSDADRRAAVVTGATGLVGRELVPLLCGRGFDVLAVSRRPRPAAEATGGARDGSGRVRWVTLDLERPAAGGGGPALGPATCLFHAAPLWLLPGFLRQAAEAGVARVVAFGSTSRFTKEESRSPRERETARRLAEAEEAAGQASRERGLRFTLLRPTLVYGGGRDRNVSAIARFVRRLGFFPIAGEGRGLRQPVHAGDLAAAALAVLDNPATFDRTYDTPGGETLAYREMVARVARGVGRTPRLVRVPLPLFRAALVVASRLPGLGHLSPDMADRMDEDLVFDVTDARRDFGYDPRPFRSPDEPGAGRTP